MSAVAGKRRELFEQAPPSALQHRAGLIKHDELNVGRWAFLAVLIGWVPIVMLTVGAAVVQGTEGITSLLWETGIHARYLVSAPLLILAERECAAQLTAIVDRFIEHSFVLEHDRPRLQSAIESTRGLLNSTAANIVVVAIAYLTVAAAVWSHPPDAIPVWHKTAGGYFSAAGWWHVLVSMPLLVALVLGWIWRLVLWTRLLWRISCLDLQLVASHPDHTAGLGFFGHSVRAFSFVAFALTAIAAGRSAQSCWKAAGFRLRSCSSMLDCWASFSSCSPHR